MATIPLVYLTPPHQKPQWLPSHNHFTSSSARLSSSHTPSLSSISSYSYPSVSISYCNRHRFPNRSKRCGSYGCGYGGGLSAFMCSTTPFIGKVGLHRRHGNSSLLSFGASSDQISDNSTAGSSKSLSAVLPFVVVATAVAALAQPSTFTWDILVEWRFFVVDSLHQFPYIQR